MKYLIVFERSIIFYLLITIVYRLMGKREVGELSIMDLLVSIFIGQVGAIAIENYDKSMLLSLIPVSVLVLLQILFSYISLKSEKIRDIVDGKPSIIIEKGKINFKEMSKQRYNIEDLLVELRNNSIKSIEEIDYAILETNGKLSIFKLKDDRKRTYPLPIIIEGIINRETLIKINKSTMWINKQLKKKNIKIENVYYAFYKKNKLYVIEKQK